MRMIIQYIGDVTMKQQSQNTVQTNGMLSRWMTLGNEQGHEDAKGSVLYSDYGTNPISKCYFVSFVWQS